ncbi:MAG: serine acetyltransferase [Gammaproteobacteria bacterium]|nr:MAG: serine acetyltransferase [Gammaproteobacteria bacterium]
MLSKIILRLYHLAYGLHERRIPVLPKMIVLGIRIIFSCDIGLGARIGNRFNFCHGGLGTVIHHEAVIEDGASIGSCVTIGGSRKGLGVPVIRKRAMISTGAKVIGPITVGEGAVVGANATVTKDVPDRSLAVGSPARVVKTDIRIEDYR